MALVVVGSSAIKAVDFHPRKKELEVFFTDGTKRIYLNVPENVYDALLDAPSTGKFFNFNIRDVYAYK